jgi:hypothetical protein
MGDSDSGNAVALPPGNDRRLAHAERMAKLAHEKNCKTKPITIADLLSLHGARPDHARALAGWPPQG